MVVTGNGIDDQLGLAVRMMMMMMMRVSVMRNGVKNEKHSETKRNASLSSIDGNSFRYTMLKITPHAATTIISNGLTSKFCSIHRPIAM